MVESHVAKKSIVAASASGGEELMGGLLVPNGAAKLRFAKL